MHIYKLDSMARASVVSQVKYNDVKDDPRFVGRETHGAAILGERMDFALIEKPPGTGSKEIFHPNEQFIYVLKGQIRATVGDEEQIIGPGYAVHIPPNVLHGNVTVGDETCLYITVKDTSWSLEALPKGMTVEEFKAIEKEQKEQREKNK